jgi:hypothetical protein
MRARVASIVVALLTCVALGSAATAVAGTAARTKLTIKGPDGDFHGKVISDDPSCVGNREVRVFMSTDDGQTWDRIGSDTSQRQGDRGVWSIGNSGFRDGLFYAKAARTTGCRRGRSQTIELVNGVPQ